MKVSSLVQPLFDELAAAMDAELMPKVIDLLVEIAQHLIERNDKARAVEILSLALLYPMRALTLDLAESLYNDLESELCPRVMSDARDLAELLTLEDMVRLLIAEHAE